MFKENKKISSKLSKLKDSTDSSISSESSSNIHYYNTNKQLLYDNKDEINKKLKFIINLLLQKNIRQAFNTWKSYDNKIISKALFSYNRLIHEDIRFPKYKIKKNNFFEIVMLYLNHNATEIIGDPTCLNIMDGRIKKDSINNYGLVNNLLRKMHLVRYYCDSTTEKKLKISFAGHLTGQIVSFYIKKGNIILLAANTFICSTTGIKIRKRTIGAGVIIGDGFDLIEITCTSEQAMVWAASYGNVQEHNIRENATRIINSGHLFSIENDAINYIKENKLSDLKTNLFGLDDYLLEFKGPLKIYTQTGNPNKLISQIKYEIDK